MLLEDLEIENKDILHVSNLRKYMKINFGYSYKRTTKLRKKEK